jgi:hypothetical protein
MIGSLQKQFIILIKKMKNRVILVTSPLQLVCSKAAIDYLQNKDENLFTTYVVAIHPHLNKETLKTIIYYTNKYNFKFLDLTKIFPFELGKKKKNLLKFFSIKNIINKIINLKKNFLFNNYQRPKNIELIKHTFDNFFDSVNEVFIRSNYKKLDLAFYEALNAPDKIFQIEDGYYDIRINSIINKDIYKKTIYKIYCYLLFLLTFMTSFKFKKSFRNNIIYSLKVDSLFSIIKTKNVININKSFSNTLRKFSDLKSTDNNNNNIVLILGSVFFYDWELNFFDEINIYNKLISKIVKNENINVSNIYYKPHPRCKNISDKKKLLNCQILYNNTNLIVEEYFVKMKISKLYSFGSTALFYGKAVFNIDSFFLDITKYKSKYKGYNYDNLRIQEFETNKKFGLKKINIK